MERTIDNVKDIQAFLEVVLTDAHRQAERARAFLVSLGYGPSRRISLPAEMLLKISVLVRIHHWEQAGIMPYLETNLPSSGELLADIRAETKGTPPRFSGEELDRKALWVYLRRIASPPFEAAQADLAILGNMDTEQLLDLFAKLCWRHRHLALAQGGNHHEKN